MKKPMYWISLLLIPSLNSCATHQSAQTDPIPAWLLAPVEVTDQFPPNATMRDVVFQALEYKRALSECSAQMDVVRDLTSHQE